MRKSVHHSLCINQLAYAHHYVYGEGMHTEAAAQPARCLRCGRKIRSARSVAAGMGPGCRARIRIAAMAEAVKGFAATQVEKARELIADGGLIPTTRPGVYRAVSSRGDATYLTHPQTCSCAAAKRGRATPCYHSLAARICVAANQKAA
jgi:hypothetical protein